MDEKRRHLDVCASEVSCVPIGRAPAPAPSAATGAWTRLAAAEEIPINEMRVYTVGGFTVLVVHTPEDFLAVQPLCPHEMVPLVMGQLEGTILTCLEHLWQFDVRTGAAMGEALEGLATYPVKNEDGQLYVAV